MTQQTTAKSGMDMTPKELAIAKEAITSITACYDYFIERLEKEGCEEVSEWTEEVFLERMMDKLTAYVDEDVEEVINDLLQ
jgi:hypothetical protein